MSALHDVQGSSNNLPQILERFESELSEAKIHLQIEGKNLERANREQPSWLSYYDERRIELHSLVKFYEQKLESVKGKLWRHYTENYSRELGHKDKEMYIQTDKEYLTQYNIFLEVQELYKQYEAVTNAFIARGYSLKNITDIRVHSLQDVTL